MDFHRNNLDLSSSPYLLQHKDNPVWWQEWKKEVLEHAKKENKLVLVSVGYSSCHWCHVMAKEAFSDQETAAFLNKHFVSIKVDREQRPDLDQFFMDFIIQTQSQGGWPLNAFLSPDGKPFFAGTYFPSKSLYGLLSFNELLKQLAVWYEKHKESLSDFIPKYQRGVERYDQRNEKELVQNLLLYGNQLWGGFGRQQQFPPHGTLLFLLSYFETTRDQRYVPFLIKTLDMMAMHGLHDHLQGGFFRYCVDVSWIIPHFEKMLYDQAMHLWVYSLAYKLFNIPAYKTVAQKLFQCLEDSFEAEGLFCSSLDAETEHREGGTYVWSYQELKDNLNAEEWAEFQKIYDVQEEGNFEGLNHLIKKKLEFLPDVEQKLLKIRKKRLQPFRDEKIITSWNALTGIGFVLYYRVFGDTKALSKAKGLLKNLLKKHYHEGKILHSSMVGNHDSGSGEKEEFLEDYASLLLFITYIHEEEPAYAEIMMKLKERMMTFLQNGEWIMNKTTDFISLPVNIYDNPTPSPASLAEIAKMRADYLLDKTEEERTLSYGAPLESDFWNMIVYWRRGNFHMLEGSEISRSLLPFNSVFTRSPNFVDCYKHTCQLFKSEEDLEKFLANPQ